MTDPLVRAAKVAVAVLLGTGLIVLLGYLTNVRVASLTVMELIVVMALIVATVTIMLVGGLRIPEYRRFPEYRLRAPIDDDVQFTVYRPALVRPAQWYPLLAFAHKTIPFPGPDASMIDPIALVEQQAQELLGEQPVPFHRLMADSSLELSRGSELVVEPWLDGADLEPLRVSLRWTEPVHSVRFKLRVPMSADGCRLTGGLRVFFGVVLIGEVTFQVSVSSTAPHASSLDRLPVRRFRQIFASYSHRDADIVRAVAEYAIVLGDRYAIDVQNLRSGEVWRPRLAELIDQSDIFQLFWSHHAMASPHVRREWEHALQLGREGFIRPVYWQEPRPADPSRDLPPETLARLHWSKLAIRTPPPPIAPAPMYYRRRLRTIAVPLVAVILVITLVVIAFILLR